MKNAIVKLGFSLLLFCVAHAAHATPPSVAVTAVTSSPTNSTTVNFTVTFSASVNSFTNADITLGGAASGGVVLGNITVTPASPAAVYNVQITGLTVNGPITVTIPAGAATEVASPFDGSTASPSPGSITFDNVKPTPTITQPGQPDPTTGSSQIKFTVTWDEPISSFPNGAVSFAGSGAGLGVLVVNHIAEIAPNNKTKYEVFVDVPTSATGNLHVIMTIPAAGVTDVAGNTSNVDTATGRDNDVTYAGIPPTSGPPTAVPLYDRFTIFGEVLTDGGISTVERGTVWSTSSPVTENDHRAMQGNGIGTFNQTRIASVSSATHYFYATYADNGVGGRVLSTENNVWTLEDPADNDPAVSAAAQSSSTIRVTFDPFNGNNDADGLIILRKAGSAPTAADLKNGVVPNVTDMPLYITTIGSNTQTFYDDATGLLPGTNYFYAVVAFSWDNSHTQTYNYNATFNTASARTASKSSLVGFNSASATLNYASETGSISSNTDGLSLGSFTLYDGDGVTNDADNLATDLHTLTIHVDNANMINDIALLDNTTIHDQGTLDGSGNITFTLTSGNLISNDNNIGGGSPDQFNIIATFNTANVVDGAIIKVTITGATTFAGSELAAPDAGGANTGNSNNAIAVIATKFVFTGVTSPINSGAAWGFTGTLKDDNDKIDTNIGGTVTVTEASLNPPTTPVAEVTKPVVSGVVVFTLLKFADAGNKSVNLDASNWGGTNNGTLNVTVASLGVDITDPVTSLPMKQIFYYNDASTNPATYTTLNAIKIKESDKTDFGVGTSQTLSLMLPPGFVFDVSGPSCATVPANCTYKPTLTKAGNEISTPTFSGFSGNNIVRITYNITGNTNNTKDEFTISNLKVKYTSTNPVTNLDILRIGGTAVQEKNSDTDGRSHGKLSSDSGPTAVGFVVTTAPFSPTETHFSKSYSGLISLQGKKVSDASNVPGVFTGTGVALDQDGIYKFNPSQLAPGIYNVVFTYTEPAGELAKSTITKQFEVYTTIINGLNSSYCIYDPKSSMTGPSNFIASGYIYNPLFGYLFTPTLYTQYPQAADPYVWYDPFFPGNYRTIPATSPSVYEFNPGDPLYTAAMAYFGGYVYVGYRKLNTSTGTDEYVLQAIAVNQRPVLDFTPTFTDGICATDGIVDLDSRQFDAAGTFDEFWSSAPTFSGTAHAGVTGDRTNGFKFDPALANPAPATNDEPVQINYKHRDPFTGCTNQIAQVISVWRKPPQVPTASISIKSTLNDTSGEFCQKNDPISSFSVINDPTMYYRWFNAAGTSEVVASGSTSFNAVTNIPSNPDGTPVAGMYSFNISQTEHRVPADNFVGCVSNLRPLTVQVFAPTVVNAGTPTIICEGNDVLLHSLLASITPPSGTLNGTWASMHPTQPGTFSPNNIFSGPSTGASNYTPSALEIAENQVVLRLRSNVDPASPCGFVESTITIRINPGITVSFPKSPVTVCASATDMLVEGSVSPNTLLPIQWTVTDGGGSLSPGTDTKTTTKYIPSFTELNEGADVELTLTTDDPDGPSGPCAVVANVVHLLISQRPVVAAGPDYEICADQPINILSRIPPTGNPVGDLTKSSASSVTWTHTGLGNLTNPNALVTTYNVTDPLEQNNTTSITFTAISNVPGGANVCPAEKDQVIVTLHPRPTAPTPIAPANYCVGDVVDLLRVGGTYPTWYNNADLDPTHRIIAGNNELATSVTSNGEKRVPFWVTQTTDKSATFPGCESVSVKMVVIVNPLPTPDFAFANRCLGDIMQFTNGSGLAQPIDPLEPARSIVSYQWNFDDGLLNTDAALGPIPAGTQDGRTTGTYQNPGHQFKNPGNYNVRLTAYTSDGCSATFTHAPIPVGPIPVTNFTVAKLCSEDDTKFTSSTGLDPSIHTTYAWDFGNASSGAGNLSAAQNPIHKFTAVATYDVSLTITTDLNCTNTITKKTSIFPYIKTFPYSETFESASHGWVPEGKTINGSNVTVQTSWNLLTSAGSITSDPDNAAGSTFWATHTNAGPDSYYYNNERSVLYGPCVDMTALQRPVLAMDYFEDIEAKGDGVYVEYLDENNPGSEWTRLGDNAGGLRWYDESSIGGLSLLGDVGQNVSQFGWSGTKAQWTTGRYNLDAFAGKTRLRFRVVFGSNFSPVNTDVFDGFALDYFRLETRNRVVLVENFTSRSSSSAFSQNRDAFKAFPSVAASGEVVKIEYHTGLPVVSGETTDPIFTQNPMDPNARASFYGLSAVPRGYIDGYSNLAGSGMFSGAWASTYYSTESLKTSPLSIVINSPTITDGTMRVTGTITASDIDLQANRYSLYVAVVEATVGTDAFVLRKMLPSASGRKVPATLKGQSFTFDESWSVDKSYLGDNPALIAVAFVQSDIINGDNERPVLQAAYNNNVPVVNFTTGVETPFLEQTAMFPNPADRMVSIELPQPTASGVEVKVIDQLGRPVLHSAIGLGQRSVLIDTSNLAGTVYIVQLKENGIYTTRRLLVTHKH